jgi:hypothetical protein
MFNFIKKIFSGPETPNNKSREEDPGHESEYQTGEILDHQTRDNEDQTSGPWVGVDLDCTLALCNRNSSMHRIGPPVPAMLAFVQRMVDSGIRVKIFTARAGEVSQIPKIKKWLEKNKLPGLEITNIKDYEMKRFYDDRGVQVEKNTGRIITDLN